MALARLRMLPATKSRRWTVGIVPTTAGAGRIAWETGDNVGRGEMPSCRRRGVGGLALGKLCVGVLAVQCSRRDDSPRGILMTAGQILASAPRSAQVAPTFWGASPIFPVYTTSQFTPGYYGRGRILRERRSIHVSPRDILSLEFMCYFRRVFKRSSP